MNLDPVGSVLHATNGVLKKRRGRVEKAPPSPEEGNLKGSEDPSYEKEEYSAKQVKKAIAYNGKFNGGDKEKHPTLDVTT